MLPWSSHAPSNWPSVRRAALTGLLAVPLLLAGCPDESGTAASARPAKNATAPALTGPNSPGSPIAGQDSAAYNAHTAANPQNNPASPEAVRQLIANVENVYSAGLTSYRSGQMDAARASFDRAMDLMLTSPLDIRGTPELSDEFDKVLSGINAMEIATLQQGSGLTQQVEISPAEEANDVTFPVDPNLRARAEAEIKNTQSELPLVINDPVASFISYFTNNRAGRATLLRSLERAGRYKELIQRILREEGVPQELIYQAVAESGFQPQAVNGRSGAGGMWQFMPFQGAYGLTRNAWFDERFDPEKSSKAYAIYMKTLYAQFGDWYLAMAAYNWGPGNVQRAVMRTGYADFWELYRRNALPTATKNYVPGIIAAIIMAKNPEKYGLDKMVPEPPVISDTIQTDYGIDLRLVADLTDASLPEIVALNPSLLRLQTPSNMDFDLHVPAGTKDVYEERVKAIPEEKRTSWRFHTVKPGESLEGIATALHSRASQIAEANNVSVSESLSPGDELVVPVSTPAGIAHPQHYTSRKGDTLVTIADRFSVTVDELRKWNHLSSSTVAAGRTLSVSEPIVLAPSMRARGRGRRRGGASSSQSAGTRMAKGRASSPSKGASATTSHHSSGRSSIKAAHKSAKSGSGDSRAAHKAAR
jgi:membrane-bound lytic murein transglycosylase D